MQDLPPDVARSWDRIRQLRLRPLAGAALADGDLPRLASDLLDELEERRRLILTSRTFAPARRTYDNLAAELGVARERIRQLETSADAVPAGRQTRLTPGVHPLPAHPASSALIMRARAFKASLEPVTPPLRNARRDTGFPAAASLRASARA